MVEHRFVEHLPDLIQPSDYKEDPAGARIRLRISVTAEGVEVLGDSMRPVALEELLEDLGPEIIEQMLCG